MNASTISNITIKEKNLDDFPNIITSEKTEIILTQMKKNICKIYMNNGSKGTGFFCKIPFSNKKHFLQVLVTNNHLIGENNLKKENTIIFTINNDEIRYKLNIGERKVYTSKNYDTTIIEIYEDKDNIHDFLEFDFNINDEIYNDIYINESIYILQYPNSERVSVSYGIIKDIDLINPFDLRHLCCTEKGSSGSPILNLFNNKIIGIHKGSNINHDYNKGTLLIYPFREFILKIKDEIKNKNIIKGVLDIKINEIKDNIILFNTFDKNIHEKIDVYINDNKVKMIKDNEKWKIDYNFEKDGNYNFEIIINNQKITNLFFEQCSNIISLNLTYFNTSNIIKMGHMFSHCNKLKEIEGLNKFITNKANDMEGMFQLCSELEYLDVSNFDTSKVDNMRYMFSQCNKLKEIKGLNKFLTNKVTDMEAMFQSCCDLEYLDLSTFDTSNVTNMKCMFRKCIKLKEIKGINKFITNKVIDMEGMFNFCNELNYLDLSNFNTSNVTNMKCMFSRCNKLKEILGINKFITDKVTDMEAMFQLCSELVYLDLSNYNTSNVCNFEWMFNGCNNLKYLNLSNFTINCEIKYMFSFKNKIKCKFITNNKKLLKLYKSSK